mgnify:FL=1
MLKLHRFNGFRSRADTKQCLWMRLKQSPHTHEWGLRFVPHLVQTSPVNQEESRLGHRSVPNRKESPRMGLGTRGANIVGSLILSPSRPKRDRV